MNPPYYSGTLLADYTDMDSPVAVLDEVLFIMTLVQPQTDPSRLTTAFGFMCSLYQGDWPAEQACNTHFHDLRHITDTMLAMARLIHGAVLSGKSIKPDDIFVGLVAALVHDAGYIQKRVDSSGTGAKYTTTHVERSMDFIEYYGPRYGLTTKGIEACQLMIHCTDLSVDVSKMKFPSRGVELLAKLLACADLIGQMGDRTYLEKLFYLYGEFEEGQVSHYQDELDLLGQTLAFFPMVEKRLEEQLGGYDALALKHFSRRWGVPRNLYREAIEKQRSYLTHIVAHLDQDPGKFLRRKQIVEKLLMAKQR
jgi:GNAT superfamily N-acetyltransferase